MAGAYELIQQYCQSVTGITTGTYNENMIQAAKVWGNTTRNLTANEAELLLLQSVTGNTTSVLADMRGYWPTVVDTGWVIPGASVDFDFADGKYFASGANALLSNLISVSRASQATSLLPTSASGASYSTFANGVASIVSGSGLLVFQAATNQLLNSTAPATQTTGSLGTGSYTLWVNGGGSATVSAGTATITGAGTATNGTPVTFTVTVAGTVTVTKSGSLNAFQLEAGTFGTSLIVTAGATATRAADVITLSGAAATAALAAKAARFETNLGEGITTRARLLNFGTGGSSLDFNSTTTINGEDNTGNIVSATLGSGSYAGLVKSAFGLDNTSMTAIANGGTKGTQTPSSWTTNATGTVYIGNTSTANRALNGYFRRATFGPTKGQFDALTV